MAKYFIGEKIIFIKIYWKNETAFYVQYNCFTRLQLKQARRTLSNFINTGAVEA
jgi:hypothetical protein